MDELMDSVAGPASYGSRLNDEATPTAERTSTAERPRPSAPSPTLLGARGASGGLGIEVMDFPKDERNWLARGPGRTLYPPIYEGR
ncbi:hypothetical protein HPB50_015738 [Hyalomma asiaticum]|uniref:Uncharacterized protein n=1 Tax=Hyalomma asiaticum TaxID=266040 RepID=A0ACB7SYY7_HYAAI|nr:hypothetical protein HPB50_015738 [Hyalomma asiaticum]